MKFRHTIPDPDPPGSLHDLLLLTDLTGNGLPDVIIGGKRGDSALFWYENTGPDQPWPRHDLGAAEYLEPSGALLDVNGNGRLDLIAGQGSGYHELYWFEQPTNPRQPWTRHLIEDRFDKYHDQIVGDVDGDGEQELVIFSQNSGVLGYYDLPADPAAGPWHDEFHLIADDVHDHEGLALADLDSSGRLAIIAGPHIYRRCCCTPGDWHREPVAPGMKMTRVAVADLNSDAWPDIILCEGESNPATLLWFQAPRWRPHLLADNLFHPHSLQIADFSGNGLPDILVGEMGLGENPNPRLIIYRNLGDCEFEPVVISEGIATHEAKVVDLTGNGRPDIISKDYAEQGRVDIWWNEPA